MGTANLKAENLDKRLEVAGRFSENYPNIPKLWILKNIIMFTDGEIQEMEDTISDQKNMKILMDQKFDEDAESENSGGGGFGGGFGGSDFGSDDFGGDDFGGGDMDFGNEEPMDLGGTETAPTEAINNEQAELNV